MNLHTEHPNKKVFIAGCFDLLHAGHLYFLREAAKLGRLYVSIDTDEKIRRDKGMGRPIDNVITRAQKLRETGYVYDVYTHDDNEELRQIICLIQPNYIAVGGLSRYGYNPERVVGIKEMRAWDGTLIIFAWEDGVTTTKLIEERKKKD